MQTASTLPVSQNPANRFNDTPVMSVEDFCDMMSAQEPAAKDVKTALVSPNSITRRIVVTPSYVIALPNPKAAQPLPVKSPDLSPAERLNKEYEKLNAGYWKSAISENSRYEIRAYDIATDTIYLQEGSVKGNEVYAVNRPALTCTCWQARGIVARTNAQLVEAGENKRLVCKHICMVNLRENALDWVEFELNLATLGQMFTDIGKEAAISQAIERAFAGRDELSREVIALSASDKMERLFN